MSRNRTPDRVEFAAALDEDPLRTVDHDVGDRVILEQGLERSQPKHVVDELTRKLALFAAVELDAALRGDVGERALDLLGQLFLCQLCQCGRVHLGETQ